MRKPVYAQGRRSACIDSIILLLAIAEISRLQLVSVAELAGLSSYLVETPEDKVFSWRGSNGAWVERVAVKTVWLPAGLLVAYMYLHNKDFFYPEYRFSNKNKG